jgi:hypothetical protein
MVENQEYPMIIIVVSADEMLARSVQIGKQ